MKIENNLNKIKLQNYFKKLKSRKFTIRQCKLAVIQILFTDFLID